MIRAGISGAAGRMGNAVASVISKADDFKLALALEAPGNSAVGSEINGVKITESLKDGVNGIDVFIDFSLPGPTLENIKVLAEAGKSAVIGTTGLKPDEIKKIEEAARKIPVVFASNFSVGVNVMWKVIGDMAKIMKDDYDIDIVESHHRHKKDAPSGTAVTAAKVITGAKGISYEENVITGRDGRDNERPRSQLGVLAVRGGGVVGEHTVIFASDGDKIEVKHTAFSRETFAAGALKAARFLAGKKPGMYTMKEVLGV